MLTCLSNDQELGTLLDLNKIVLFSNTLLKFQTSRIYPLLDKVMSRNQTHVGVHQGHLMFKGHWRAPYETIFGHKKKVYLDKTFPLGNSMLHFIMFLIHQMITKASNVFKIIRQKNLNIDQYTAESPNGKVLH